MVLRFDGRAPDVLQNFPSKAEKGSSLIIELSRPSTVNIGTHSVILPRCTDKTFQRYVSLGKVTPFDASYTIVKLTGDMRTPVVCELGGVDYSGI